MFELISADVANAVLGLLLGASVVDYIIQRRKVKKLKHELAEAEIDFWMQRLQNLHGIGEGSIVEQPKRGRGRPRKNRVEV